MSTVFFYQGSELINAVTKVLYPSGANQYQTTNFVVRAIRHASEVAWERDDSDNFDYYFGYNQANYTKPTPTEFIATIADYIKSTNNAN